MAQGFCSLLVLTWTSLTWVASGLQTEAWMEEHGQGARQVVWDRGQGLGEYSGALYDLLV